MAQRRGIPTLPVRGFTSGTVSSGSLASGKSMPPAAAAATAAADGKTGGGAGGGKANAAAGKGLGVSSSAAALKRNAKAGAIAVVPAAAAPFLAPPLPGGDTLSTGRSSDSASSQRVARSVIGETQSAGQQKSFKITPAVVTFENVEVEREYTATITIVNTTHSTQRLRVVRPTSRVFLAEVSDPSQTLAPGMSMRVKVRCYIDPALFTADERKLVTANDIEHHNASFAAGPNSNAAAAAAGAGAASTRSSQAGTAPGASSSAVLCHDRLILVPSDDLGMQPISIPLHANPPAADIRFDPVLNLGTSVLSTGNSKSFELRNFGTRHGRWRLEFEDDTPLTVQPKCGVLAPRGTPDGGDTQRVMVQFTGTEVGTFHALASVYIADETVPRPLDITVHVVEESLELVFPDSARRRATDIQFGSLYFGQKKVIRVMLVNNSPSVATFGIGLKDTKPKPGAGGAAGAAAAGDMTHHSLVGDDDESSLLDSSGGAGGSGLPAEVLIIPPEGRLEPYTQIELDFIFQPRAKDKTKAAVTKAGSAVSSNASSPVPTLAAAAAANTDLTAYEMIAKIDSIESKQRINVAVHAIGVEPRLSLSTSVFNFGSCPVNERRDISVKLTNFGVQLPVQFEFSSVAHFRTEPAKGTLAPNQSKDVVVSFVPRQMGRFQSKMSVSVCSGVRVLPLRLSGVCDSWGDKKTKKIVGGTDKIPSDFKVEPNWVDPAVVAATTTAAALASAASPVMPGSAAAGDVKFGGYERASGWRDPSMLGQYAGRYAVKPNSWDSKYTHTLEEVEGRDKHRAAYGAYLEAQRVARDTHAHARIGNLAGDDLKASVALRAHHLKDQLKIDPTDFTGLGMEHASGLKSPRYALPDKPDKLWLQYPMAGYDGINKLSKKAKSGAAGAAGTSGAASGKSGAAAAGGKVDETRLVTKKFKQQPTTHAETRDCETPLTYDDLQNIHRAPKVVDFGRFCLNSVQVKNFSVTNDLTHNILVVIHIDCDELSAYPVSQMIPPGEVAGFDIRFKSPLAFDFKKSVHYTINGQHNFNFICVADVVPMALNMSVEELTFAFARENLAFTCTESVVLTNPSNVPIDFWWTTKSDNFSVSPAKGTVEENKSLKIEIMYRPKGPQRRFEEDITLYVKNGPPKNLLCIAALPEAHCAFKRKVIDFGTLCVGFPVEHQIKISNTGKTSTVFRFTDLPAHIRCTPPCARIEAGAVSTVIVTLTPAEQAHFDHTLTCEIRGQVKPLKVKVEGEAIVPDVTLHTSNAVGVAGAVRTVEFDFGGVTVGQTGRKPLVIENRSPVAVTLFLDLTSRGEEFNIELPTEWLNKIEEIPIQAVTSKHVRQATYQQKARAAAAVAAAAAAAGAQDKKTMLLDEKGVPLPATNYHNAALSLMSLPPVPLGATSGVGAGSISGVPGPIGTNAILAGASANYVPGSADQSAASGRGGRYQSNEMRLGSAASAIGPGGGSGGPGSAGGDGSGYDAGRMGGADDDWNAADDSLMNSGRTAAHDRAFQITIGPERTLTFHLTFTPNKIGDHNFQLPLELSGVPAFALVRRLVAASGLKPKLTVSTTSLDFEKRVILKKERAAKNPYILQFNILNAQNAHADWRLKMPDFAAEAIAAATAAQAAASGVAGGGDANSDAGAGAGERAGSSAELKHQNARNSEKKRASAAAVAAAAAAAAEAAVSSAVAQAVDGPSDATSGSAPPAADIEKADTSDSKHTDASGAAGADAAGDASLSQTRKLAIAEKAAMEKAVAAAAAVKRRASASVPAVLPFGVAGVATPAPKLLSAVANAQAQALAELREREERTWRIEPSSGQLAPNGSVTVSVYFSPTRPQAYSFPLSLYLGENSSEPYLKVPVQGTGTYPMLAFDVDEVALPSVPLGITGTTSFTIVNRGYDQLELRYTLPQDTARFPLSIKFPFGATLGMGRDQIVVEVSFMSKKPLSFATKIDFLDQDANRFSLPVHGSTDNSLLTVQPWMDRYMPMFGSPPANSPVYDLKAGKDNRPVQLIEVSKAGAATTAAAGDIKGDAAAGGSGGGSFGGDAKKPSPVTEDNRPGTAMSDDGAFTPLPTHNHPTGMIGTAGGGSTSAMGMERTISLLLRYLSACFIFSPAAVAVFDRNIDSFPLEIVRSNGKSIRDMIRFLTGKYYDTEEKPQPYGLASRLANISGSTVTHPTPTPELDATAGAGSGRTGGDPESPGGAGRMGTADRRTAAQKNKEVLKLYADYQKLLSFLKAAGALLSHVRAEHLLSYSQYVRLKSLPEFVNAPGAYTLLATATTASTGATTAIESTNYKKTKIENTFPLTSRAAWMSVLYQMIKTFILSRVTTKHLKSVPGITFDATDRFDGSNLYSSSESIVLKWLTFHFTKQNPHSARRVINFSTDCADGLVLAAVLLSHVPTLKSCTGMHAGATLATTSPTAAPVPGAAGGAVTAAAVPAVPTAPLTEEQRFENASKVIAAIKEVGLHINLTENDIANPIPRDMMLICLFLYQHLPSYVPRTTIEFKGRLHDEIVKSIELTNPTTKPINYAVRLEGSTDFTVDTYNVRIGARGTAHFPVKFKSRFSRSVEARLIFTSDPDSSANAATLVFLCKSSITGRTPHGTTTVARAKCYETAEIDVAVRNPFPYDCAFALTVRIEKEPEAPIIAGGGAAGTKKKREQRERERGERTRNRERRASLAAGVNPDEKALDDPTAAPAAAGAGALLPPATAATAASVPAAGKAGAASANATSNKRALEKAAVESRERTQLPPAFWCRNDRIKIKRGETGHLNMQFMPFRVGEYKCQLILLDEATGEFMQELTGTATTPAPIETLKWQTTSLQPTIKELLVAFRNPFFERCRSVVAERVGALTRKQRELRKLRPDWASQLFRADALSGAGGPILYQINSTNPFFAAPQFIKLKERAATKDGAVKDVKSVAGSSKAHSKSNSKPSSAGGAGGGAGNVTSPRHTVSAGAGLGLENQLEFQFSPKGSGLYRCELVMTSEIDVRVYALECQVQAPMNAAASGPAGAFGAAAFGFGGENKATVIAAAATPTLEFKIPARQKIRQDIPIVNPTEDVWTFRVTVTGEQFMGAGSVGSGSGEFIVQPKSTAPYPLTFFPQWMGVSRGRLEFHNTKTSELLIYDLYGSGEEPVAEEVVKLECQARQIVEHKFRVKNHDKFDQLYTVESDLPNITGAPSLYVKAGTEVEYALKMCPQLSGNYTGSLTFTTADKRYQWFAVELIALAPKPEQTLTVTTCVRKAASVQIGLANPLATEPLEFDVVLNADGAGGGAAAVGLFGEHKLKLAAGDKNGVYEFIYAPLKVGNSEGSISFVNEKAGEFWYALQLRAENPPPIVVKTLTCAVGQSVTEWVELENPTDREVLIRGGVSTNPRNFNPASGAASIRLPARASTRVGIAYTPSTIGGDRQTGEVRFSSAEIGDWVFEMSGVGSAPKEMEPVTIVAPVHTRVSSIVPFRNPFSTKMAVTIHLFESAAAANAAAAGVPAPTAAAASGADAFTLFLKKTTGVVIAPFSTLQIPFTFQPHVIVDHSALLTVQADDMKLMWSYALKGVAEGPVSTVAKVYRCRARTKVDDTLEWKLDGLVMPAGGDQSPKTAAAAAKSSAASSAFRLELEFGAGADINFKRLLESSVATRIITEPTAASNAIRVGLVFAPLRPFDVTVSLIVRKESGGRWKFPLHFIATDPPIDDVIKLEATLNKTESVSFKLCNVFDRPTPFTAQFSADSPLEFKVTPKFGTLPPKPSAEQLAAAADSGPLVDPSDAPGATITVSFTPKEYGKTLIGKLVVETDDLQFLFETRGSHPTYIPPEGKSKRTTSGGPAAASVGTATGGSTILVKARPSPTGGRPKVNHLQKHMKMLRESSKAVRELRSPGGGDEVTSPTNSNTRGLRLPAIDSPVLMRTASKN